MQTTRRGFLKSLLSGLGVLTALPLVAGKVKASEVFEKQASSLEEELAKLFLDVGEYKMSDVEGLSIMRDWKIQYAKQGKEKEFSRAMQRSFGIAKKINAEAFNRAFRHLCRVVVGGWTECDVRMGYVSKTEMEELNAKDKVYRTTPFKRPLPRI